MTEQIENIINELLELDPSLKGQEAAMKETIEKLLSEKPDTGFDEDFKAALKAELLKEYAKKVTSKRRLRPAYWGVAAMFAVGALALSLWFARPDEPEEPPSAGLDTETRQTINEAPADPVKGFRAEQEKKMKEMAPQLPPAPKAKSLAQKKGVEKDATEFEIEEGVEGGIEGGVEGVVLGGVLGAALGGSGQPKDGVTADTFTRSSNRAAHQDEFNTEGYAAIQENEFLPAMDNPLSTFSIDVDTASYSNVRRFLTQNRLPPIDAVRIEELINYFDYNYELPKGDAPFAIHRELCAAPWNPRHKLAMIALKGKDIPRDELPSSNLVFLIDVSGSMSDHNKLPLLRESFKLLVRKLDKKDRVALVVYAGAAGLVLPSTSAREQETILDALDRLQAGGSTAGGAGIALAYQIAEDHFIKGGNNRVILATDGDFNVGASSDAEMERLIESRRDKGIFLSVLGFGMGNYKDSKMEILADKGNGNYAYIDSLMEAKKVLADHLRKTLFTIAKDVKIQVEFNPSKVGSYRLLGYENRMMKNEDFRNDKKDAGEIGAGHSVTAFYEIIPATGESGGTELKYQDVRIRKGAQNSPELLTVRVRYKKPDEDLSREMAEILEDGNHSVDKASVDLRFASAVAEFGLLMRDSKYKGLASFEALIERARKSLGEDAFGYRHEFIRLAETAAILIQNHTQNHPDISRRDDPQNIMKNTNYRIASIKSPVLVRRVEPVYPPNAERLGIEATVTIKAQTNVYGHVVQCWPISGHPLLNKAAEEAVANWIYEPYIINGVPRPVQFTVDVHFKLKK